LPCEKVFEDEHTLAFMDIMPRADGHTLVVPKNPSRNLLDVGEDDLAATIFTVQKVARAVKAGMGADGLTLQQFNESAGGQVVFHLHFHILPRWEGVALRPHTGEMAPAEKLREFAGRIRAALGG
jgi:histidine triad (HIT) family protein